MKVKALALIIAAALSACGGGTVNPNLSLFVPRADGSLNNNSPQSTSAPQPTATANLTIAPAPAPTGNNSGGSNGGGGNATPTATPTETATPSATATSVPTDAPTATASPSASPSVAPSATASPSATATATPSATATSAPSPTATAQPTVTTSPSTTTTPISISYNEQDQVGRQSVIAPITGNYGNGELGISIQKEGGQRIPFAVVDPIIKDERQLIAAYKAAGIRPLILIDMRYKSFTKNDIEAYIGKIIDAYPDASGFYIHGIASNLSPRWHGGSIGYLNQLSQRMKYSYEFIKSKNPNYLVVVFEGDSLILSDSTDIEYKGNEFDDKLAKFADIHIIIATTASNYIDRFYLYKNLYDKNGWISNPANGNRIMHSIHEVTPQEYDKVIELSRSRNAQWLYVNDYDRNDVNTPADFTNLITKINLGMPQWPVNVPLIMATPTVQSTKATASATPSATAAANNAGNPFINRANNAANNLQNALQKQQDQLNAIGGVKASARRDANGKVTVDNGKGPDVDKAQKAPTKSLAGKNGGLMLDVARQFYTVEELKGFINDVAAANGKFFHLHLSDNENFALESEILGQTAEKATRSRDGVYTGPLGNNFYSKEQIRQLAQYASSRGVELVPEVDLPGHSAFIYELLSKSNPKLAKQAFGGDSQAATKFAQDLYLEVAKQFTGSRHFHMGGDDFTGAVEQNASYISYVNANASALKAKGFTPRIWNDGVLVSSLGKLDKAVEITYHVSGGEKASITNLIGSGYKVINYGGRTDNAVEGTALAVWSKNGKAVSGDNLRTKLQRQIAPASNGDEDASNPNGGANKR